MRILAAVSRDANPLMSSAAARAASPRIARILPSPLLGLDRSAPGDGYVCGYTYHGTCISLAATVRIGTPLVCR